MVIIFLTMLLIGNRSDRMKLIPKKGGNGYVSSYTLNISLNLARQNDLLNEDGTPKDVELKACEDGILISPTLEISEGKT